VTAGVLPYRTDRARISAAEPGTAMAAIADALILDPR